jgi:hypothetical protein
MGLTKRDILIACIEMVLVGVALQVRETFYGISGKGAQGDDLKTMSASARMSLSGTCKWQMIRTDKKQLWVVSEI